jgi:uncharacterized SAM-dependent methyltransferase
MLSENGGKFMETHSAKIVRKGDDFFLCMDLPNLALELSLTEDKPAEVRAAFNKLIVGLKSTPIAFTFEKKGEDLFQQIGEEYIKQLNSELATVRKDLEEYEMVLPGKG